jgi:hypothetical protein
MMNKMRRQILAMGMFGAVGTASMVAASSTLANIKVNAKVNTKTLTYELYDAFQRVELDRWDAIIKPDVQLNSPGGWAMSGLETLKNWAAAFAGGLAYQIDLADEHLALDSQGNGRGFITFVLNWKHTQDFFGLKPTGREGTSIETLILRIEKHQITRIDVADNSLDLAIYLWERGWPSPHNIRPELLVQGIKRRPSKG